MVAQPLSHPGRALSLFIAKVLPEWPPAVCRLCPPISLYPLSTSPPTTNPPNPSHDARHQVPASLHPPPLTPPGFRGCSLPSRSTFLSWLPDTTLASAPPLPPPPWPPPGSSDPDAVSRSRLWRHDQEMPTRGWQPRISPHPSSTTQALPRLMRGPLSPHSCLSPAPVQTAPTGDGGTGSDPIPPRPQPHQRLLPEHRRPLMPPTPSLLLHPDPPSPTGLLTVSASPSPGPLLWLPPAWLPPSPPSGSSLNVSVSDPPFQPGHPPLHSPGLPSRPGRPHTCVARVTCFSYFLAVSCARM